MLSPGFALVCLGLLASANGHGRLMDPPSRSSMWRVGFDTPKNYNDNALFCGGVQNQYGLQNGKCGICGDPYQGPRENEVGGKYATGIISRVYKQGQLIDIAVEITANHLGWFEFKICPYDGGKTDVTQTCLDKYALKMLDGSTRFYLGSRIGWVNLRAQLPPDVTCSHCVLQWRWHTGNSWGTDPDGAMGMGHGNQEEFYGCADVTVISLSGARLTTVSSMGVSAPPTPTTATTHPPLQGTCIAISPVWKGRPTMDQWCDYNCRQANYCPEEFCACQ